MVSGPVETRNRKPRPSDQTNLRYSPMKYALEGFEPRRPNTRGLERNPKKHEGVVMHWSYRTYEEFWKRYDNTLVSSVVGRKDPDEYKQSMIIEAIVYIPEISGCLPLPDMKLIDNFMEDLRIVAGGDDDMSALSDTEQLLSLFTGAADSGVVPKEWHRKVPKQIKRLDRFPRFFAVADNTMILNKGSMAEVEFPNSNDYTVGILNSIKK